MATVSAYSAFFGKISTNLATLQVANPTYIVQIQGYVTRLEQMKSQSIQHATQFIPQLNSMMTNATAASGFLGKTIVTCPLFNQYLKQLESIVDTTILEGIDSILNSSVASPITEVIQKLSDEINAAEAAMVDIINFTNQSRNKFNNLIQRYVNMSNMLRNPCNAMTFLANSQLVGELNPTIQSQANQALEIVESSGGQITELTSAIQQKIVDKATIISGILT